MSYRKPYTAINFPDGTAFERSFPVDTRNEAIAAELTSLPGAIESGLILRGAANTYLTLPPGISTHPALGEVVISNETREEMIKFKMRQLTRGALAKSGMTLASLMFSTDNDKLIDFSVVGINGLNPHAEYADIDGHLDEDDRYEFTAYHRNADGKIVSSNPMEPSAVGEFLHSIRDFSATPEPTTDSIDDQLHALFSGAEDKLLTRSGRYTFEEDGLEIAASHSTLYRANKKPLINYRFEAQEIIANPSLDSKRAHIFSIRRRNTKRGQPIYHASFGMSIHSKASPEERGSSYEMMSMYFLENPDEFYASLGRMATLFSNPFHES